MVKYKIQYLDISDYLYTKSKYNNPICQYMETFPNLNYPSSTDKIINLKLKIIVANAIFPLSPLILSVLRSNSPPKTQLEGI